jgi:hypothetical protein
MSDEKPMISVDGAQAYPDMIRVDCGDGAVMSLPTDRLRHQLRYNTTATPLDQIRRSLVAAGALDCYIHLVAGGTLKESLRRIRIMRKALKAIDAEHARQAGKR